MKIFKKIALYFKRKMGQWCFNDSQQAIHLYLDGFIDGKKCLRYISAFEEYMDDNMFNYIIGEFIYATYVQEIGYGNIEKMKDKAHSVIYKRDCRVIDDAIGSSDKVFEEKAYRVKRL